MKPKKLIRRNITSKLKAGEWEDVFDRDELNKLYALKIREELDEIQKSEHKDIWEFADLLAVTLDFAKVNGFDHKEVIRAEFTKRLDKGDFGTLALNNLNPNNPSNALYFDIK